MTPASFSYTCSVVLAVTAALASGATETKPAATPPTSQGTISAHGMGTAVSRELYRLGPGDEIKIQQPNAEELDGKTARVDDHGDVNFPLVGRLEVGGLTVQETEALARQSLTRLLVHPDPVVSITEYRSQPVSVLGAVNTPGVIQLQGRKTLVEMLSMAGGLKEGAGTDVQVTRRLSYGVLPLPGAVNDPKNEYSLAKVNLAKLLKGDNPAENIVIFPQDIISVPHAELIYVSGTVKKPGAFPLTGNGSYSVLQAVSMAEGLGPQAAPKNAKIFRQTSENAPKVEIAVNVQAIMAGKTSDVVLMPQDILFIPDSRSKKAGVAAAQLALQAAMGAAWRF
jgi:polysaccharide export outer membrane protein